GRGGQGRGRGGSALPEAGDASQYGAPEATVDDFLFPERPIGLHLRRQHAGSESDSEPLAFRKEILSGVDERKRASLETRKQKLGHILDTYDTHLRELYYLEHNLPLLEFNAERLKADKGERIVSYLKNGDLRTLAAKRLAAEAYQQQGSKIPSNQHGTRRLVSQHVKSLENLIEAASRKIEALLPRSATIDQSAVRYASLEEYLSTFYYVEDEEVARNHLEERASAEADIEMRISEFKKQGLLTGLTAAQLERKLPAPQQTHWTRLLQEMEVVSAGFAHAGKERLRTTRLANKAVQKYWELRCTSDERRALADERELKAKMKQVIREFKKRWNLVVDIIKIQHSKILVDEQRLAGKRQLDAMIEHSSTVLQNRLPYMSDTRSGSPSPSMDSGTSRDDLEEFSAQDEEPDFDFETDSNSDSDQAEMDALHTEMTMPVEDLIDDDYFAFREASVASENASSGSDAESEGEAPSNSPMEDDESRAATDVDTMEDGSSPFSPQRISLSETTKIPEDTPPSPSVHPCFVDPPDISSTLSPVDVVDQNNPAHATDREFVLNARSDEEDDDDAERELDLEEPDDDLDSDDEMKGLENDANMDVDALREWMRKMDEEHAALRDTEDVSDSEEDEVENEVSERSPSPEDTLESPMHVSSPRSSSPMSEGEPPVAVPLAMPPECNLGSKTGEVGLELPTDRSPNVLPITMMMSPAKLTAGHQALRESSAPIEDNATVPGSAVTGTPQAGLAIEVTDVSSPMDLDKPKDLDGDQSLVATKTTVEASDVTTPIPFLLKHTMREYQHVGLDWLAGLYESGLNGILADEMGLGKTIQTIALFAHLAIEKQVWGPHLIVVPTSVMLNWECEFKKWLPGFKLLTYYGNIAERAAKRVGWAKSNSFHVCITSYQIVLRDQHIFRRKRWCYLVLDEAHNIKNFRSQRWQTLLGFNTERRLLLTGTPLQNSLMELWSLLYFLMPADGGPEDAGFAGRNEFKEWFEGSVSKLIGDGSNLMASNMADAETRESVSRLHAVLRPYILRRLKADVEKQMPGKFEHVVKCRLSKRQRFLYDDFMSRAKTKEDLASGNYLSIVNVLMQLRKVCNHPNLFEDRPVVTGFAMLEGGVAMAVMDVEETLVWRRLLKNTDVCCLARVGLQIVQTSREGLTGWSSFDGEMVTQLEARAEIDRCFEHAVDAEVQARGLVPPDGRYRTETEWMSVSAWRTSQDSVVRWQRISRLNRIRCETPGPFYGRTLVGMLRHLGNRAIDEIVISADDPHRVLMPSSLLRQAVHTPFERASDMEDLITRFACVTPRARIYPFRNRVPPPGFLYPRDSANMALISSSLSAKCSQDVLSHAKSHLEISFPDKRLIQFDCGKLQTLDRLLRTLKAGSHRALIFTQMTKMLDILEVFLNLHGHRYLRLDGSTKVESRQILMERFNNDKRILVFILSTRSGGVGMNLTGADTVIFYDSDWNPAMDAQAQDRAHRIGQTREVHIYRFVSEHTIEENMLRKADQKRRLDRLVIQAGDFTTEWVAKSSAASAGAGGADGARWRDWLDPVNAVAVHGADEEDTLLRSVPIAGEKGNNAEWEKAIMQAEDETDVAAYQRAQREADRDVAEFDELGIVAPSATAAPPPDDKMVTKISAKGILATSNVLESPPVHISVVHPTGPLDDYLFRLQIYRMGLSDVLDWRDFAEELKDVGEERARAEERQ
ncbi:swr1 complex component, partial [Thoreauomyces humboldtii]